ncbi:MAG: hypothetical protein H7A25_18075 [Leptospiraceae bacterium]|nr:hypothetical protein [Leptospiraceae bacterium]MCP5501816.1 hypothetical protein [Leptospiraceae bacterium]
MNTLAIRENVKIINNKITIELPLDFDFEEAEIIIFPVISNKSSQKKLSDKILSLQGIGWEGDLEENREYRL